MGAVSTLAPATAPAGESSAGTPAADGYVDLLAEFADAYSRITDRQMDHLAATRVPVHGVWSGLVGARVVETEGRALLGVGPIHETAATGAEAGAVGAWEPAETGRHAIIVPVGATYGGQWWEEIHDLVAFRLAEPGRWWLRTGEVLLGAEHVDAATGRRGAITLVATPLDWLRLRGEAACVLDWTSADPRILFAGAERIECCTTAADGRLTDAPELAATLRRRVAALTRPGFTVVAGGSRGKES